MVLPAPLAAALRNHRAPPNAERLAAGTAWADSGLIFTTPFGKPIDPRKRPPQLANAA
jgi:integrase